MFESRRLQRAVWAAVLVTVLSASAWAAGRVQPLDAREHPARVGVFPDEVIWEPLRDFEGATLILSTPDGGIVRREFEAGVTPSFHLASLETAPADGRYLWEVCFVPRVSAPLAEALREAAEKDEPARTASLNRMHAIRHGQLVQTGQFFVREGRIEPDGDDLEARWEAGAMLAVTGPAPPGPVYTFDVSGDWTLTGDLGVGTDIPSQEVDIVDASPTIQMEDSSSAFSWFVNGNSSGFDLRATANSTSDRVFFLDSAAPKPSLWVNGSGNWGNGTSTPSFPLHVRRTDGTARVQVEEASGVKANRSMFELRNNGGPFFFLTDTSSPGRQWLFSLDANGDFQFSRSGTGGPELKVLANGRVQMGPGASTVFNLAPNGNLIITGSLTANGILYPSGRDLKTDIGSVDVSTALRKAADLPVFRWRYKSGDSEHIGPMAQDFYAAFNLGPDDKHINPMDLAGVALAALQGLHQQLERTETKLRQAETQNLEQETRIRALEQRLAQIESKIGSR